MDASTAKSNRFDVIAFLTNIVLPTLSAGGRHIEIQIVEDDKTRDRAWVDFGTDRLCVQRNIWEAAERQEPFGRLVIAHEIGHLVLHRDQVYAFSRGLEAKLNFLDASESAECQANWFAWSLLLPDSVLRRLRSLEVASIATLTLVSERLVIKRIEQMDHDKRQRNYMSDECPNCGTFAISDRGVTKVCENCGWPNTVASPHLGS